MGAGLSSNVARGFGGRWLYYAHAGGVPGRVLAQMMSLRTERERLKPSACAFYFH